MSYTKMAYSESQQNTQTFNLNSFSETNNRYNKAFSCTRNFVGSSKGKHYLHNLHNEKKGISDSKFLLFKLYFYTAQ